MIVTSKCKDDSSLVTSTRFIPALTLGNQELCYLPHGNHGLHLDGHFALVYRQDVVQRHRDTMTKVLRNEQKGPVLVSNV